MKILKFTYEYGHTERVDDQYGTRMTTPVRAISEKHFIVQNDYDFIKEMLWAYVEKYHLSNDDKMFKRVSCVPLNITIDGIFKEPAYWLKDF
ncbi:hypothetical protein AU106_gp239 [Sinorhizobium phage phiM9]|uniref:Uncharacterized protein n=1 Tax=Sinorhizobium phage phiM9 TaxID=1636182 RepID=A0A0F6R638_9CAUD|nr:hypothetical protein AU106_gp239 [Sinorhizobium phage phiM9]AKE44870.1 hypothetical protein Sm_phiM9_243 [Sinorhizobium phage phiM9]